MTDFYENMNMTNEMRDAILGRITKVLTLRKVCNPQEIAKHIAFLASDDSSFITGSHLLDDGGMLWIVPATNVLTDQ